MKDERDIYFDRKEREDQVRHEDEDMTGTEEFEEEEEEDIAPMDKNRRHPMYAQSRIRIID